MFLTFTGIFTPFSVCIIDDHDQEFVDFSFRLEIIFDIIFGIDLFINFFSAYYDKNNYLVTNLDKIAINYLSGWFWIDLFAL